MTIEHKNITDPSVHEPKGITTAVASSVYRANGSGSGTWDRIGAFGGMRIQGGSTATTINTDGVFEQVVADWATGPGVDVTFDTDHLEVLFAGNYKVDATISFTGQTGQTFGFDVAKNGTAAGVEIERKTSNTDVGALALTSVFVGLVATDELSLIVRNIGATGNPTITHCVFNCIKL